MKTSAITDIVNEQEGGRFYTIKQVAEKVGRSSKTIKRWIKSGKVSAAEDKMRFGELGQFTWIYTQENIDEYIEYSKVVVSGRPRQDRLES